MWELYDELIAGIPEELHVKRVVSGSFWTAVESERVLASLEQSRE